mmetsp:Transcript_29189/g.62890  ORF Transcript_29189/g.62890 Transcript_29189/m.62890 type:complete len:247 (-) Transcript_29189:144-884(-)
MRTSSFLFDVASSTTSKYLVTGGRRGVKILVSLSSASSGVRGSSNPSTLNRGRSITKVAPLPRPSEDTRIVPPCCSAMPLPMNSPSPLPPPACSVFALNWTPSLQISPTCAGDRPAPSSTTVMRTAPARALASKRRGAGGITAFGSPSGRYSAVTVTAPFSPVNLRLLDMRLRSTCVMRVSSPRQCKFSRSPTSRDASAPNISPCSWNTISFSLACSTKVLKVRCSTFHTGTMENSSCSVPDSILS